MFMTDQLNWFTRQWIKYSANLFTKELPRKIFEAVAEKILLNFLEEKFWN